MTSFGRELAVDILLSKTPDKPIEKYSSLLSLCIQCKWACNIAPNLVPEHLCGFHSDQRKNLLAERGHIVACPDMESLNVSLQALPVPVTASADRARYFDKIHSTDAPFVVWSCISRSMLTIEVDYHISLLGKLGCECIQISICVAE